MCVSLSSCSDDENKKDPLIGNWYYIEREKPTMTWEYTYTFEADGSFEFSGTTGAWSEGYDIWEMEYGTSSGRYKQNGKTLTIEYLEGAFKGDVSTYTIMSLSESNLVLKGNSSGRIRTFTRL